jgi:hypothetical protein
MYTQYRLLDKIRLSDESSLTLPLGNLGNVCVWSDLEVTDLFKNCPLHRKKSSSFSSAGLFSLTFQFIPWWWGVEISYESSVHDVTFHNAVIATAMIASDLTTQTLAGTTRVCRLQGTYFVLRATFGLAQTIRTIVFKSKDGFTNKHTNSFIPYAVLRQEHDLFHSDFSTQCDLMHPLSISSILSSP